MTLFGLGYAEVAVGLSFIAAVLGFVYSIVDVVLKVRRTGKSQWQPLPYAIGFAIFWPAFCALLPFIVLDNVVARGADAERPWAVRLSSAVWYRLFRRMLMGLGLGVMACYVAGFFL